MKKNIELSKTETKLLTFYSKKLKSVGDHEIFQPTELLGVLGHKPPKGINVNKDHLDEVVQANNRLQMRGLIEIGEDFMDTTVTLTADGYDSGRYLNSFFHRSGGTFCSRYKDHWLLFLLSNIISFALGILTAYVVNN